MMTYMPAGLKGDACSGRAQFRIIAIGMLLAILSAGRSFAVEYYTGDVVGKCQDYNNVTYNVVATIGSGSTHWFVNTLTYTFSPTPTVLSFVDDPTYKTRYFSVTPGTYAVAVTNSSGLQGSYSVAVPNCSKGLTWGLLAVNAPTGTIRVGCGNACDAYHGDTQCTSALPLLCIKKSGTGFPVPVPASVDNTSNYNKWAGGIVGTTAPIVPPSTLTAADAICAAEFGAGWRVAEFHDGWGWAFQAYGGVANGGQRFWLHINDSPGATCWH